MKIRDALATLLGWVLLAGFLLGLLLIVAVPVEMRKLSSAREWPSRRGLITHSSVQWHAGWQRRPGYWSAEIGGRFQDGDEQFWISRVRYGDLRIWRRRETRLEEVARYPVGAQVDVFCDPDHPRERILEPLAPWIDMQIGLAIGVGFLLTPVLLYAFRKQLGHPAD